MTRSRPWIAAAAAGGLLVVTGVFALTQANRRAELEERLRQTEERAVKLSTAMDDARRADESAKAEARTRQALRQQYERTLAENKRLREEKEEASRQAKQIDRARDMVEKQASVIRKEAEESQERADRLEDNLVRTQEEAQRARREAEERRAAAVEARNLMRSLVAKVRKFEAKEADYEHAVREYEKVVSDAEKSIAELQAAERRIAALSDEAAVAHYNAGVLYARQGQYADAARELDLSVSLDASEPAAHYNLGLLYDAYLGDSERAVRHYREYIRLLPSAPDAARVEQRIFQARIEGKGQIRKKLDDWR